MLDVRVTSERELRFDDGAPVRAASAVARLGTGWLIAQDDATAGAWLATRGAATARRLRLLPPVAGHDVFSEAAGTKRAKPDLEAGLELPASLGGGVLLLGSGSLPNRRRAVLVGVGATGAEVRTSDLRPLYERVTVALGLAGDTLNLEGACVVGDRLRWFQRGHHRGGVPSASVDVDLAGVVAAVRGDREPDGIEVSSRREYDLGAVDGVSLAVTDAVTLPDGRIVVSASAEDTVDAVADGPVAGSAVAILDGADVVAVGRVEGPAVLKLEGIAVVRVGTRGATLLGVVDQDDPATPSLALDLELTWA